ncbi:reverse transcriptase domain-containing protein [Pedobacter jamesrossensis]|uniref:Reverse transcriptase domain-containing protein n=1 Tax=Pedobacter jamesrossensis TaxID=1908238 RepID=A0ABV8NJX0_9SPHI
MRVKLAHRRNKDHLIHLHTSNPQKNYHRSGPTKSEELLCSLFPPRKKWKTVLQHKRFKDGAARSTSEKTLISLYATIKYFERTEPTADFLVQMNDFIKEIQSALHEGGYKIASPKIIPKLKEDKPSLTKKNICRPIASFGLKDKIILSITNRYLTAIFDPFFIDRSYAFRYKRMINGKEMCPTHHEPVEEILTYRKEHDGVSLFVAECDMKKFFDTVNHSVIKGIFRQFFDRKLILAYPVEDIDNAKRILYDYLDVYTFNHSVLPLNDDQKNFKKFNIPGKYEWVKEELISNGYYKRVASAKIGIPQGGALSGLIANVVLHGVDKQVIRKTDAELLYVRFCDDMLIIHPDEKECASAFNRYLSGIRSKKLVVHQPVNTPYLNPRDFWAEKSKSCYVWGSERGIGSPWIGFVGYEIHHQGYLRVRKSSLMKEMKKQFKVVGDLKLILKDPHCRSSENTIYESVANRLIGMSVGRVNLWNYRDMKNEMCWTSGYRLLTDNKYTRIQLKRLDSSRNRLLLKLRNKIAKMKSSEKTEETEEEENAISIEQIYLGSPFSYYYQTLKNKR